MRWRSHTRVKPGLSGRSGLPVVETLQDAARDYWDHDRWAIDVTLWTDGSVTAYAYHSRGRNNDGHLVEERLYPTDDGVRAARVERVSQEVDSEDLGPIDGG